VVRFTLPAQKWPKPRPDAEGERQFSIANRRRRWPNSAADIFKEDAVLTAVEKITLLTALVLSVMACQQSPDPAALRAAHYDSAQYFDNDRLRADTLIACKAGTAENKARWAALYACRTSASVDLAKHSGWKPGTGSAN
jgi:hypothetical protein